MKKRTSKNSCRAAAIEEVQQQAAKKGLILQRYQAELFLDVYIVRAASKAFEQHFIEGSSNKKPVGLMAAHKTQSKVNV